MMAAMQRPILPQTTQDMSDIDRYINYDQVATISPSRSPVSPSPKSTLLPNINRELTNATVVPSPSSSQQTFAAPSHQYAAYPQNNGLPTGALLDSIPGPRSAYFSSNYNQQYYGIPPNDNFAMTQADNLDFGFGASYIGSQNDMDIDFSTSPQSQVNQSADIDFIDPAAIGGQEKTTPAPPQAPRRAYPGMHQQQAALAKAQAEAQQQKHREAIARQQHNTATLPSRTGRSSADPVVEERISRILNEMRHNSAASLDDDDTVTHDQGSLNRARSRKDEEEMDEDERLLASEEGKKLSSKERRQLRNKVSARAFRSRRKEYIGQLEGEIATKTAEADELRVQNQALKKENAQLLSLTRNLLSSPAFSEFLNEMGGMPNTTTSSELAQPSELKAEPEEPALPKDPNPNQILAQQVNQEQQNTSYIGMAMIPEHPIDFNAYDTNANTWGGNMGLGLYDTQVFAVMSIPEGPAIDELQLANLSGKPTESMYPCATISHSKEEMPLIERMPTLPPVEVRTGTSLSADEDFDESDPVFTLYTDSPAPAESIHPRPEQALFGHIELEKAFGRVELILEEQEEDADDATISLARTQIFERLCSSLDEISESISAQMPHR